MLKIDSNSKFFFREAPFLYLTKLHDSSERIHMSSLVWETRIAPSHITKISKYLHKKGLITIEKMGRIKVVVLTEKGQEMALHLKKAASLVQ